MQGYVLDRPPRCSGLRSPIRGRQSAQQGEEILALLLLDGDLGRLSRGRDGDSAGVIPKVEDGSSIAQRLARKNQQWVEAARHLSPRLITDLLAFSTARVDEWTAEADLLVNAVVSWASDEPVPAWLDMARELTESWVHHQQIRAAVGRPISDKRLPTVLRTFAWALPHQYRASAEPGTIVSINLDVGGVWRLVADGAGHWSLEEAPASDPAASVVFTADAAWRSFTGAPLPEHGVQQSGPPALTRPVLDVRGIIA